VCGKPIDFDYNTQKGVCPQCHTDLGIYVDINNLTEEEAKELLDELNDPNSKLYNPPPAPAPAAVEPE